MATGAIEASVPAALPATEQWSSERVLYQSAKSELSTGAGQRYSEMRAQLAHYPLRIDLDFAVNIGQLHHMKASEAREFLSQEYF